MYFYLGTVLILVTKKVNKKLEFDGNYDRNFEGFWSLGVSKCLKNDSHSKLRYAWLIYNIIGGVVLTVADSQ